MTSRSVKPESSGPGEAVLQPVTNAQGTSTLDLVSGSIFGGAIGMDENAVRAALTRHGLTQIEKVDYPHYFLLQSRDHPGIIWRFRDRKTMTEIYTNSRKVVLSNGLRLGQPMKRFTEKFGQSAPPWHLPSRVGEELAYPAGEFELGVIRLNENPETAHALTLRRIGNGRE